MKAKKKGKEPKGEKGTVILVVDDEPDLLSTVEIVMNKMGGYKVVTAKNGEDCLEKINSGKVDLVLLDIMMPGISVDDVVSKISKSKVSSNVKIIYLTAVTVPDYKIKEMMKSKQVVDFIKKPFDIDELLDRVKKALK